MTEELTEETVEMTNSSKKYLGFSKNQMDEMYQEFLERSYNQERTYRVSRESRSLQYEVKFIKRFVDFLTKGDA